MNFLVTDRSEGRYDHVQAIEPWPTLDEMKASHSQQRNQHNGRADHSKVSQDLQRLSPTRHTSVGVSLSCVKDFGSQENCR